MIWGERERGVCWGIMVGIAVSMTVVNVATSLDKSRVKADVVNGQQTDTDAERIRKLVIRVEWLEEYDKETKRLVKRVESLEKNANNVEIKPWPTRDWIPSPEPPQQIMPLITD